MVDVWSKCGRKDEQMGIDHNIKIIIAKELWYRCGRVVGKSRKPKFLYVPLHHPTAWWG